MARKLPVDDLRGSKSAHRPATNAKADGRRAHDENESFQGPLPPRKCAQVSVVVDLENSQNGSSDESGTSDNKKNDPDYAGATLKAHPRTRKRMQPTNTTHAPSRHEAEQAPKSSGEDEDDETELDAASLPQDIPELCHILIIRKRQLDATSSLLSSTCHEVQRLGEINANLERTIKQLNDEIIQSNDTISALNEDIKELADQKLDLLRNDRIPADPDNIVAQELEGIFEDTRLFCKKWSVGDWSDLDNAQHEEIVQHLEDHSGRRIASPRCILAVRKCKIAPSIILHTLINVTLCQDTLQRPFAHLRHEVNGVECQLEDSLKLVCQLAGMRNGPNEPEKSLNKLRADIARAIQRPKPLAGRQGKHPRYELLMQQWTEEHCYRIVETLLHRYGPLFKSVDECGREERSSEILTIVKGAWEFSCKVALQYSSLSINFYEDIKRTTFKLGHRTIVPHRGLKLKRTKGEEGGVDPVELGINRVRVDLVVEPYVCRVGDHDGNNYEKSKSKLLCKGVVWVVPPAHLEETAHDPGDLDKQTSTCPQPQADFTEVLPTMPDLTQKPEDATACAPATPLDGKGQAQIEPHDIQGDDVENMQPAIAPVPAELNHKRAPTPTLSPRQRPAQPTMRELFQGALESIPPEYSVHPQAHQNAYAQDQGSTEQASRKRARNRQPRGKKGTEHAPSEASTADAVDGEPAAKKVKTEPEN
ncbi:hypothetical protein LTR93_007158 [Exophiala xenobiotica]|nr:hypothetical protein LTR93_007158 [Exophiala xenobiotica]KAK5406284.1 hypothetical protein LTR06_008639 [Exophiala xenobiotica]